MSDLFAILVAVDRDIDYETYNDDDSYYSDEGFHCVFVTKVIMIRSDEVWNSSILLTWRAIPEMI